MLVQHHPVKANLFGVDSLVKIGIVELAAHFRIEMFVGYAEITGVLDDLVFRNIVIGALGEHHDVHGDAS